MGPNGAKTVHLRTFDLAFCPTIYKRANSNTSTSHVTHTSGNTSATHTSMPANSEDGATGLLDLPPELRLMIYEVLLPEYRSVFDWYKDEEGEDVHSNLVHYPSALGREGPQYGKYLHTPPSFLVNRQIYEEASQAFYGAGIFGMCMSECRDPWTKCLEMGICVMKKEWTRAVVDGTKEYWFPPFLRRISHLRIRFCADSKDSTLCDIQTALHAVTTRLGTKHALKSLSICVDFRPETRELKAGERRAQSTLPLDSAHFLLAPISNLFTVSPIGKSLDLKIMGEERQPMPELAAHIRASAHDRKFQIKYQVMIQYSHMLKVTLNSARSLIEDEDYVSIKKATRALSSARITGDIGMLQDSHQALTIALMGMVMRTAGPAVGWIKRTRVRVQDDLGCLTDALVHVVEVAGEGSTAAGGMVEEAAQGMVGGAAGGTSRYTVHEVDGKVIVELDDD